MSKHFVVYEVWTRARVVTATSADNAMFVYEPKKPIPGLSLCNWHAVEVVPEPVEAKA